MGLINYLEKEKPILFTQIKLKFISTYKITDTNRLQLQVKREYKKCKFSLIFLLN